MCHMTKKLLAAIFIGLCIDLNECRPYGLCLTGSVGLGLKPFPFGPSPSESSHYPIRYSMHFGHPGSSGGHGYRRPTPTGPSGSGFMGSSQEEGGMLDFTGGTRPSGGLFSGLGMRRPTTGMGSTGLGTTGSSGGLFSHGFGRRPMRNARTDPIAKNTMALFNAATSMVPRHDRETLGLVSELLVDRAKLLHRLREHRSQNNTSQNAEELISLLMSSNNNLSRHPMAEANPLLRGGGDEISGFAKGILASSLAGNGVDQNALKQLSQDDLRALFASHGDPMRDVMRMREIEGSSSSGPYAYMRGPPHPHHGPNGPPPPNHPMYGPPRGPPPPPPGPFGALSQMMAMLRGPPPPWYHSEPPPHPMAMHGPPPPRGPPPYPMHAEQGPSGPPPPTGPPYPMNGPRGPPPPYHEQRPLPLRPQYSEQGHGQLEPEPTMASPQHQQQQHGQLRFEESPVESEEDPNRPRLVLLPNGHPMRPNIPFKHYYMQLNDPTRPGPPYNQQQHNLNGHSNPQQFSHESQHQQNLQGIEEYPQNIQDERQFQQPYHHNQPEYEQNERDLNSLGPHEGRVNFPVDDDTQNYPNEGQSDNYRQNNFNSHGPHPQEHQTGHKLNYPAASEAHGGQGYPQSEQEVISYPPSSVNEIIVNHHHSMDELPEHMRQELESGKFESERETGSSGSQQFENYGTADGEENYPNYSNYELGIENLPIEEYNYKEDKVEAPQIPETNPTMVEDLVEQPNSRMHRGIDIEKRFDEEIPKKLSKKKKKDKPIVIKKKKTNSEPTFKEENGKIIKVKSNPDEARTVNSLNNTIILKGKVIKIPEFKPIQLNLNV